MPTERKTPEGSDIQDGGVEPAVTEEHDQRSVQPLKLRVPATLLAEVDAAVARRRPSPSRHQWILEAIYEKLDREAGN